MASSHIHIRDYRTEIPGALSGDRSEWVFPVVESVNTHGKKTVWRIYVRMFRMQPRLVLPDVSDDAWITIEDEYFDSAPLPALLHAWYKVDSGIEGGKMKISSPTIVTTGKNLGKVSATNAWTQALRDVLGIYNKQVKKSAVRAIASKGLDTTTTLYPPMLAQLFTDQKRPPLINESSPIYVQRKYNGVRVVTTISVDDGTPIMYSRGKNIYPGFAYIKAELIAPLRAMSSSVGGTLVYLDGEIYKHGAALQDISGYARREDQPGDVKYDYMVYDCFVPSSPGLRYTERHGLITEFFKAHAGALQYTKCVETFEARSSAEIDVLYKRFLAEGYEGAMLRTDDPYQYSYNSHRSKSLLKMKPAMDAEYLIVDYTTGSKGKAAAAIMIICTTDDGKIFPVTPAMELPERNALAAKMPVRETNGRTYFENHWKGQRIIVTFDEFSKTGLPQRARTRLEKRTWE